jgi:hypothetical protein
VRVCQFLAVLDGSVSLPLPRDDVRQLLASRPSL